MLKFFRKHWLGLGAFVYTLVGILVIALLVYKLVLLFPAEEILVDPSTYQAVFLESNQIYFGKLRDIDSPYSILDEVYYVKLEGENITSGRLVKLGETEPHGPQNQMIINRDHILFWENLKSDSQVVQTIRNLKLNQ